MAVRSIHPDGLGPKADQLVTDPAALKARIIAHAERLGTAEGILADVAHHDDETILAAARFCLTHSRDPLVIGVARGLYARISGEGIRR